MDLIPKDIFTLIGSYLSTSDVAMLSITNKFLLDIVDRKYRLLDMCITDGNIEKVKLCEYWDNEWKDSSYFALGMSGSIELLEYKCIKRIIFMSRIDLNNLNASQIYKGACYKGNMSIIEWLNINYKMEGKLLDIMCLFFRDDCISLAAQNHHYHILDYFRTINCNIGSIWVVAGELLDIELVEYCMKNKVRGRDDLFIHIDQLNKPIEEIKSFLDKCKELDFKFTKIKLLHHDTLFELQLLLVSYGVKYESKYNETSNIFLKSNINKVDWRNDNQRSYILYTIGKTLQSKQWNKVILVKEFMRQELEQNNTLTREHYDLFIGIYRDEKSRVLSEF